VILRTVQLAQRDLVVDEILVEVDGERSFSGVTFASLLAPSGPSARVE
jgi:hypothetical protein